MQIKRLEFGIAVDSDCRPHWKDLDFHFGFFNCRCFNISVWIFYVTWLGDECYSPCQDPACECQFPDPEDL